MTRGLSPMTRLVRVRVRVRVRVWVGVRVRVRVGVKASVGLDSPVGPYVFPLRPMSLPTT